ncbi:phosphatase and actin regulator 2 isoform X2 [Choloepus didactylus]|uniref:phosphatase and actin regulator 2 isoform X2 n=1 Tax=Choloepus didactylus TaxID=27675 RepID=UPI00189EE607|nr:phosphatase and actin regulator 2 isoform X2 [Choloepus didactylus]
MGQTSVSAPAPRPGSVDGLDKASIANADGPAAGAQTPPFKRKGRLSTIGKIFKPWKWRRKKTSDKFRETSAVLERKISTRQSREELIRRGVLKELPDEDGDVTVNFESSNGHLVPIGEETSREENVVRPEEGDGPASRKATLLHDQAEDGKENTEHRSETAAAPAPPPAALPKPKPKPKPKKTPVPPKGAATAASHRAGEVPPGKNTAKAPGKQAPAPPPKPASRNATREAAAGSSHSKRTTGSKVSASPSTPSTSSRPRASKETVSSKTGTVGTTKGKKKPGKPSASRPSADATSSSSTDLPGDLLEIGGEGLQPELIVPEGQTPGKAKPGDPAPPEAPLPPAPAQPPEDGCLAAPAPPAVLLSEGTDPPTPALDTGPPHWTEGPTSRATVHPDASSPGGGESAGCFTTSAELGKATPRLLVPGLEDGGPRESLASDSDSDGPVLYTDDDDDEDEDGSGESALASKIRRRDTLAIKLGHRPSKKELEDKNILQRTSEEERQEIRQQIGAKLVRRLSQRPTTEELEQRNILKQKNEEEEQEAKMELKRRLSRKLSLRPTVAELQARRILRFNEYVEVTDSPEYDRRADKPWVRLTPADKAAIRKELNEFKSTEMEVHEESRQFTRFHRP